jgi:hypothetical protein
VVAEWQQLRGCLGLLRSRFCSSALTLSSQTPPTPKTYSKKKVEFEVLQDLDFCIFSWSWREITHQCHLLHRYWFVYSFLPRCFAHSPSDSRHFFRRHPCRSRTLPRHPKSRPPRQELWEEMFSMAAFTARRERERLYLDIRQKESASANTSLA